MHGQQNIKNRLCFVFKRLNRNTPADSKMKSCLSSSMDDVVISFMMARSHNCGTRIFYNYKRHKKKTSVGVLGYIPVTVAVCPLRTPHERLWI